MNLQAKKRYPSSCETLNPNPNISLHTPIQPQQGTLTLQYRVGTEVELLRQGLGGCGWVLGFKSSNCGHEGLPVECGHMS